MMMPRSPFLLAGVALGALALPALAATEKVGVSSAVNPAASSAPPNAPMRTLYLGADIVYNERIVTEGAGQAQLLFLDQSAFTVGPDSDIVIDEFVYDPKAKTGKLVASASKGVLRFVGGALSKNEGGVTVKTPVATIGIRGGIALINIGANGSTEATLLYGKEMRVESQGGGRQVVTRAGFATKVEAGAAAPTPPAAKDKHELAGHLAKLEGSAGATGGAPTPPTDQRVAESQIAQVNSAAAPPRETASEPPPGAPPPPPPPDATKPVPGDSDIGTPPPPSSTAAPISFSGFSGVFRRSPAGGTAHGFTDQSASRHVPFTGAAASSNALVLPLGAQGTFSATLQPVHADAFTFGVPDGSGTASPLGPVLGLGLVDPKREWFFLQGFPADGTDQAVFAWGGVPTPEPVNPQTMFEIHSWALVNDPALANIIPFLRNEATPAGGNISVSPLYLATRSSGFIGDNSGTTRDVFLQASLAIDGAGAAQGSAIAVMNGHILKDGGDNKVAISGSFTGSARLTASDPTILAKGGMATVTDGAGNRIYGGGTTDDPPSFFVLDQNSYAGTTLTQTLAGETHEPPQDASPTPPPESYAYTVAAVRHALPPIPAGRTTQTLTGYAAGIGTVEGTPGSYNVQSALSVSTDVNANRAGATMSTVSGGGLSAGTQYEFGGTTGAYGNDSAFVTDRLFGAQSSASATSSVNGSPASSSRMFMITADAVAEPGFGNAAAALLPTGAQFCECEWTRWGFWGGVVAGGGRTDHFHINTWVAGRPTTIPAGLTGTATYAGHAIGAVDNAGARYLAAGAFQNTVDFSANTYNVAISNFDGKTFTGTGSLSRPSPTYSTSLSGPPGMGGAISGSFYQGPSSPVGETGGRFSVTGTGYNAAGVFAGKKQ